ncbi:potassium channel family protein [Agrococcus sp. SGAir0287]|uniref:potassium channel family protein n=1 Tax=Agrococcus sp. SGAir0287 TaxID=2070347 RepID=UPI0010CD1811|nr:TrkA family potassium uptake protein [Agrococcus sp. SGAir0287]QCR19530.1 potassium transporter [Agrococcus sp. SGAir0287]
MARQQRIRHDSAIAVIGLGRFGASLAIELADHGTEVLGVDAAEDVVQSLHGTLAHVVQGDSTDPALIEQLGLGEYARVVVAIGSDVTASILTTSQLLRAGVSEVWAKAISEQHAVILDQLGVHHVVSPEADMGRRVAHMVRGSSDDFLEVDSRYGAMLVEVPSALAGVPLRELGLQREHGVSVIATRIDDDLQNANTETRLQAGGAMLVAGPTGKVEAFAALAATLRARG